MTKVATEETFIEVRDGLNIYLDPRHKRFVARDDKGTVLAKSLSYNTLVRKISKTDRMLAEIDKIELPADVLIRRTVKDPNHQFNHTQRYAHAQTTGDRKAANYHITFKVKFDDGTEEWHPSSSMVQGNAELADALNKLDDEYKRIGSALSVARGKLVQVDTLLAEQRRRISAAEAALSNKKT